MPDYDKPYDGINEVEDDEYDKLLAHHSGEDLTERSHLALALHHVNEASDELASAIAELKGEENKNAMRHAAHAMASITRARGQLARAKRAAPNETSGKGLAEIAQPILKKGQGILEDALEYEQKRLAKIAAKKKANDPTRNRSRRARNQTKRKSRKASN